MSGPGMTVGCRELRRAALTALRWGWPIRRPTKTVGDQLIATVPRSCSPARARRSGVAGRPGIRLAAVLRGHGPCPDDPHLAAPEDHWAPEQLISHGFGRSRSAVNRDRM